MYEKIPNIYNRPTYRQSSPKKPIASSDYLQQMYADMDRIDRQLEMVVKAEVVEEKACIAKFDEDDIEYADNFEEDSDNASMKLGGSDHSQLEKMEDLMKDVIQHSDKIQTDIE
eukprot:GFUD01131314.1.p1 GENE.GFUD01131314.1~~GFUD01131314.1.p1  ORF type:complete len:114 (+),score=47.03 GFUD01131314.1:59-400(+)